MQAIIQPGTCQGSLKIPPAKSLAHRAIIAASLANGKSTITNFVNSADVDATIVAMKQLGAKIKTDGNKLSIQGINNFENFEDFKNSRNFSNSPTLANFTVNCNESASTLRFLLPVFALCNCPSSFTGSPTLLKRPMQIYEKVFAAQNRNLQITPHSITLAGGINPANFVVAGNISSQFISGLLFATPLLKANSTITIVPPLQSKPYINLTIATLKNFGIKIAWNEENKIFIPGKQNYQAPSYPIAIPGDYSHLAFFAVLAVLNHDLTCTGLQKNSSQGDQAIIKILQDFGADITEIADGYIFHKSKLHSNQIDLTNCPDLGPILTVLAACTPGTTVITNAARLRLKESDRIFAMETELQKMGVKINSTTNAIQITGRADYNNYGTVNSKNRLSSHNDHRIAMSLAIFATCCQQETIIEDAQAINKSYPHFFADLQSTSIKIKLST